MKLLGILLLSVIPVSWGIGQYIHLNRRTTLLIEIVQLILTVKERIRFTQTELDRLLSFLHSQPGFSKDVKLIIRSVMKKRNYNDILEVLKKIKPALLKEDEIFLLSEFFASLGQSDIKGQIELCEFYFTEFERIKTKEESVKTEKSRLSLGLSMALSAVIFIILI